MRDALLPLTVVVSMTLGVTVVLSMASVASARRAEACYAAAGKAADPVRAARQMGCAE